MSCSNVYFCTDETNDRISELPDAIILRILSLLPAEDAVRSGVLSKRFSYLWTNVPRLRFDKSELDFIMTTLLFHERSSLDQVSLIYYEYDSDFDYLMDEIIFRRLIRVLSLAKLKDLALRFNSKCCYALPQHFYSYPSLRNLELGFCGIVTNGFVNWKSLQTLSLHCIEMSEKSINEILFGSPSLGFLELINCSGSFGKIDMSNNRFLTKMKIHSYDGQGTLEIVAPYLQTLVVLGIIWCSNFKLINATSLTDFYFDVYGEGKLTDKDNAVTMLTSLLNSLPHVESVTMGEWVLPLLSSIESKGLPCPISNSVKSLKLFTVLKSYDMCGIACLLRGLNFLEKLVIIKLNARGYYIPWCSRHYEVRQPEGYWESEIVSGFDLKLKNVEICRVAAEQNLLHDQNVVLLLLKFLLRSAKCMESMTIRAHGSRRNLHRLTNKLQGLPRTSSCAVIKIVESV